MKIPEKMRRQALATKYRFIYKNIGQKITGAKIIFSSEGFRHLTRRGQRKRSIKDMRHRLNYLPLIPEILEKCPIPTEIRGQRELFDNEWHMATYAAYDLMMPDRQIRMVTRSIKNSTPHFQSIFEIQY